MAVTFRVAAIFICIPSPQDWTALLFRTSSPSTSFVSVRETKEALALEPSVQVIPGRNPNPTEAAKIAAVSAGCEEQGSKPCQAC